MTTTQNLPDPRVTNDGVEAVGYKDRPHTARPKPMGSKPVSLETPPRV